jgi:hypothetical protein
VSTRLRSAMANPNYWFMEEDVSFSSILFLIVSIFFKKNYKNQISN